MGVGVVCVGALALGLLGPLADTAFLILGAGAVVATVVGLRRNRPAARWPWMIIAAALVVFLVGGGVREAFGTLGDLSADRSLVPDLITLSGYAILGIGVLGLANVRRRGARDVEGRSTASSPPSQQWRSPGSSSSTPRCSTTKRPCPCGSFSRVSATFCLHRRDDCADSRSTPGSAARCRTVSSSGRGRQCSSGTSSTCSSRPMW